MLRCASIVVPIIPTKLQCSLHAMRPSLCQTASIQRHRHSSDAGCSSITLPHVLQMRHGNPPCAIDHTAQICNGQHCECAVHTRLKDTWLPCVAHTPLAYMCGLGSLLSTVLPRTLLTPPLLNGHYTHTKHTRQSTCRVAIHAASRTPHRIRRSVLRLTLRAPPHALRRTPRSVPHSMLYIATDPSPRLATHDIAPTGRCFRNWHEWLNYGTRVANATSKAYAPAAYLRAPLLPCQCRAPPRPLEHAPIFPPRLPCAVPVEMLRCTPISRANCPP